MSEALTINGVSLTSLAYMVDDISGVLTVPSRRGENVIVPGRHGVVRTRNKRFDANEIILSLWIVGAEADGSIPGGSTERIEFFERRDELLNLLYADPLLLEFTRPNGHAVNASCEVVGEPVDFTRRYDEPLAKVAVALSITGAFWQDAISVSQEVTGPTGTVQPLTAFVGATAPIQNLLITFFGPVNNPMIAVGNRSVKYNGVISSGQQLVLNTETWQLSPGSGSIWSPDIRQVEFSAPPTWLELDPTTTPFSATFTHTGGGSATCTIAGRRTYLAP